jgi:hypothetical protein
LNLTRLVCHQREGQLVLGSKLDVTGFAVARDTEDRHAVGAETIPLVAKRTGFLGTAGRFVFGIEVHDCGRAALRRERHRVPGRIATGEIGCLCSDREQALATIGPLLRPTAAEQAQRHPPTNKHHRSFDPHNLVRDIASSNAATAPLVFVRGREEPRRFVTPDTKLRAAPRGRASRQR